MAMFLELEKEMELPDLNMSSAFTSIAHTPSGVLLLLSTEGTMYALNPDTKQKAVIAGTGRHKSRDGPALEASFRQACGLVVVADERCAFVGDDESVRRVTLPDRYFRGCCSSTSTA
jgi:hypothetical protein